MGQVDERELDRLEAIILSMTPARARPPDEINGSRRKRIATGSGTTVQAVNRLVKQFGQMRKLMKQMSEGKMPDPQQLRCGGASAPRPRGRYTSPAAACPCESDFSGWGRRRTRSGGSSSPTSARRATAARSRRSASTTRRPDPSLIVIDEDRARHWLEQGAQPTRNGRHACSAPRASSPSGT